MNKLELIEELKKGNYKVELQEDCNCSFDWAINNAGGLDDNCFSDNCWVGNVLTINGDWVGCCNQYENYEGIISQEELEENGLENITNDMKVSEDLTNDTHARRRKQALVDFIKENEYICGLEYPRNFANEYTCYLANNYADIDMVCTVNIITPEEFAEKYLADTNNTCNQYWIGFKFLD